MYPVQFGYLKEKLKNKKGDCYKMKKFIKKVCLGTLLLATSCVALSSCNKNGDSNSSNSTVTESYPYMDKMYRNVYIISDPTDLKSSLWTHGEDKIDTCINTNINCGENSSGIANSGIAVRFKEGTKLRSITFSIKTLKACYVNPYISGYTTTPLSGWDSAPAGKYIYATGGNWQEENEVQSYTVTFGNGEEFKDPKFKKSRTWVNFDSSTTDIQKCVGFGVWTQNADFKNITNVKIEISKVSFIFD